MAIPNWITLSQNSGNSGVTTITITANTYEELTERTGQLTVKSVSSSVSAVINLTQNGREEITIVVSPILISASSGASDYSILIVSNGAWTATTPSWISLTQTVGTGNTVITATISESTSTSPRTGDITFSTIDNTASISVMQSDREIKTISVSPMLISTLSGGGTYEISIVSNGAWSATTPSWITLSTKYGTGDTTVTATVNTNTTITDRTDNITFNTVDNTASVSVSQTGREKRVVSVSPTSISVPQSGGTYQITVTSNSAWTVTIPTWVTVSQTGGTGNTVLTVTVNENETAYHYTGNIVFSTGDETASVAISQERGTSGYENMYFTIEATSTGELKWYTSTSATNYFKTIYYSKDFGSTWTSLESSNDNSGTTLSVSSGDTIMFKGSNSQYGYVSNIYTGFENSPVRFITYGNIMSLIYGDNFSGKTSFSKGVVFFGFFGNCTGLTSAENLVLPATTLTPNCYQYMFNGCSSLTTAPELPATSLSTSCYYGMFEYCTSLRTTPELPATTLPNYCYSEMFYGCSSLVVAPSTIGTSASTLVNECCEYMFAGCSSLTTAPELPATSLAFACYEHMFLDCSSLRVAPLILPATTLDEFCYEGMFQNCTSLRVPPVLPATTVIKQCYQYMFAGCTSLTTAPELPATTLTKESYQYMFSGCSSLNYIKCLATDISITSSTQDWVAGVASAGTFVQNVNMSGWTIDSPNGIPNGWTVKEELMVSPKSVNASSGSGTYTITISSDNHSWTASTNDNWLTISPLTGGTGNTTVTVSVTENTGYAIRYGNINITDGIYITNCSVVQKFDDSGYDFQYLKFRIISGGTIYWKKTNEAKTISYSKDDGFTWNTINSNTGDSAPAISVNSGDVVMFKGNNSTYGAFNYISGSKFSASTGTQFEVEGNIMSLVYGDNFVGQTVLPDSAKTFADMFSECSGLTSAENLILPATSLTDYCYYLMFEGCKNLKKAPALPAITLGGSCYYGMFDGCKSLELAPRISATSFDTMSCAYMFQGCASLIFTPNIGTSATTMGWRSCEYMFSGCTSLTNVPQLPATTLGEGCYEGMFLNCTSLTNITSILPATTLAGGCYSAMFKGCTSLVNVVPKLPATDLTGNCYKYMFQNCTSLTKSPSLSAVTTMGIGSCTGMFQGCTSLSTASTIGTSATTMANSACTQMFSGCTSLTTAPELPSRTLANYCYYQMFVDCTSLTTAPELPATTLTDRCYGNMFARCSSLSNIKCLADNPSDNYTYLWTYNVANSGTFIKKAGTAWPSGTSGIPDGWTVQEE